MSPILFGLCFHTKFWSKINRRLFGNVADFVWPIFSYKTLVKIKSATFWKCRRFVFGLRVCLYTKFWSKLNRRLFENVANFVWIMSLYKILVKIKSATFWKCRRFVFGLRVCLYTKFWSKL